MPTAAAPGHRFEHGMLFSWADGRISFTSVLGMEPDDVVYARIDV